MPHFKFSVVGAGAGAAGLVLPVQAVGKDSNSPMKTVAKHRFVPPFVPPFQFVPPVWI